MSGLRRLLASSFLRLCFGLTFKCHHQPVTLMDASDNAGMISEDELEFTEAKLTQIRERVLEAEKDKLHYASPIGVINEVEDIIREEVQ